MIKNSSASPTRPRLVSAIGMAAAIFLGIAGFAALSSLKPAPKQTPPPKKQFNVDVFRVQESCLRETISGFGTARPDREVTLSAQVAGEILEHDRKVGQTIPVEQPLLEIDPRIYQQRYEQAENQLAEGESELRRLKQEQANAERLLAQAESDFQTAKEQYQRRKALLDKKIVTPDELARALLEFRQYEEALIRQQNDVALYPLKIDQVEKRQATTRTSLELARLDLDHTKVLPPFPAIVSEVFVETGQYVRVGDPLISLTNADLVEIPVPIKLSDYAKLRPLIQNGDFPRVELATDVSRPAQWMGRLTRTAPQADRENRTIEVYVEVDNSKQPSPLVPGTFVYARIAGPVLERVFAIPRDAIINDHVLIARPEAEEPVVQRRISPRDTLQDLAILENGLRRGDQLILTNLDVLYRDPAETQTGPDRQERTLTINQEHDLTELLEEEARPLVEILECPKAKTE